MQLDSILYIVYSVTSITVSAILALLFWDRRKVAGARYMCIMMCSAASWALSDFISDLSVNPVAKIRWDNLSFLGIVILPVAWIAFTLEQTRFRKFLSLRSMILFCVIPLITTLMLWTNDLHHFMLASKRFLEVGQLTVLATTYGPWFWVHAAYSYLLIIAGTVLLFANLATQPTILRNQSATIIIASFVPLVFSVLYVFRILPTYPIDTTIFSFTVTGILCFIGMFRYKLFNLIPAARDAVIEGMSGCVAVLDNENHIIDLNPAAKSILDIDGGDYIGKDIFVALKDKAEYFRPYEHVKEADEKISFETEKGKRCFDIKIAPLVDNKGRVMGKTIALYDITALEDAVKHFKEAHRAAEEANNAKSQFLATMSHEIRTPLNGIIGLTELLSSAGFSEEEKGYLQSVQISAGSLLDIVNDILDFSKIEAGKMDLEKTGFSFNSLIEATFKTFVHNAKGRELDFVCNIDPEIPENLIGDPVRVRQILVNLLGNAFKFTKEGRIEILAKLLSREENKALIRIAVCDTGIGVPEDKIECLFESFQQVDSSTTRKYGGTGLGLTIVKKLVTMMDGEIEVESKEGEGSCFAFTIPFLIPEGITEEEVPSSKPAVGDGNSRVLLVDDNRVNQMLIIKLLEKVNVKCSVANNGIEALEKLESDIYNLVLMDIQMPEMDGYEATLAIRKKEEKTGRHIPVIALTANADEKDKNLALQAGMDYYLTKPIRTESLYECLGKFIAEK